MYRIVVILKECPVNFLMTFREYTLSSAARESITKGWKDAMDGLDNIVTCKDEAGHTYDIRSSEIVGMMFIDLPKETEVDHDSKITQAHSEKRLQDRAASDPLLKFSSGFQGLKQ